ncbi:adenosine monophosphate-protein transferase Fic [soil metagenome]
MHIAFDPEIPYNALPPLPPAADLETVPVLKAVTRASRALAELKGRTGTLPNPAILINTIALQEAKASSEIENLFTTQDELYRGLSLDDLLVSPHAKEVLHYNEALWLGARRLAERPVFSTNLFVEIVETIKNANIGIRCQPGTKIAKESTGQTVYTPPEGEAVIRGMLANLETFCNATDDDLDPLVKTAVLHYQFEAIHPFYDGNGRAGRILLILYLLFQGLLDKPILYLSRYLIEHKGDYYRLLRGITERAEWEPWLLYVLRGVEQTARQTSEKILAISTLLDEFVERGKTEFSGRSSKELVELLFVRPYCKIRFVEEAGIAKRVTASRYLHKLAEKDFVTSQKVGAEILFINHRLLALLTS